MLIVIRGPAGAGKSTVARLVMERLHGKVTLVEADYFLDMVKEGTPLNPEQCYLTCVAAGRVARVYLEAGYTVVVDGTLVGMELPLFLGETGASPGAVHMVTLLPSVAVAQQRNAGRDPNQQLSHERIAWLHEYIATEVGVPGVRIDSSVQSAEETARIILAALPLRDLSSE